MKKMETLQDLFQPLLQHVEKALENNQDGVSSRLINFQPNNVRGVYLFGSQVYFSSRISSGMISDDKKSPLKFRSERNYLLEYLYESDFDILLVCDDLESEHF